MQQAHNQNLHRLGEVVGLEFVVKQHKIYHKLHDLECLVDD